MPIETSEVPRVAVRSVGAVTALGGDAAALWAGARDGRVGIRPVQRLDLTGVRTKVGGEVDMSPESAHPYPRPGGFRDRMVELALRATDEAMAGAGDLPGRAGAERCGVVFGTCNAGLLSGREWLAAVDRGEHPPAGLAPMSTPQATGEALAGAYDFRGPVFAVNTACASGANAVGWAADLIRSGQADVVLTGGSDAFSDVLFGGFHALEALSPEPARPYSRERQGLSLGEGAAFLVLAREDLIAADDVLGWVGGYGLSADGYHPTAPRPDGSGASRAITQALRSAGARPDEVGYVNGHGTGTDKNDPAETQAIRTALGDAADTVPVSSTKSVIGHLLGAAGAAEAVVTVHALEQRTAPPTASYAGPDPACDLDYVPLDARALDSTVAVSNNFAFGGSNASLALLRADDRRRPPAADLDDVVVTGLAALGPFGDGVAAAREAAHSAGVPADPRGRVGTMTVDPEPHLSRKQRRRMDRMTVAAVVAADKALADAELADGDRAGTGVLVGTSAGPVESMAAFTRGVLADGPSGADPALFPNTVYNQPAGQVAQHLGLHGPTSTVSAGHASGATALAYACQLLRTGHADAVVCLAVDLVDELVVRAYRDLGVLSTTPGDRRFAVTDAAVAVVLERRGGAERRGARSRALLAGYGSASHVRPGGVSWDLGGDATARAGAHALHDAGIAAGEVAGVWTAAAGLAPADRGERAGLRRIFGDRLPPLHEPKKALGEPVGPGGALTTALAVDALDGGGHAGPALVNATSLGGTAVSLVVSPAADDK
ncbi:3-oxoacyl-[acyl-carrier-protein] synthase II [Haloactinopolyspora alba]|uniref:3-oxoacyl-[acyl-carrier-protein] synthase II n=1 Tax=Haloactinopolyspora alba TaxID=648780 RepID=A0A2P8DYR8_9ACTN|nr:beta-ketoacyl-[acyl-carrier-protein] synthase family protein [Haloactinopolyspora alba]PSL02363.1 3-oxoacyl-[acyl-carrier-protein] synthase II [Haloactinopolyspora alba]